LLPLQVLGTHLSRCCKPALIQCLALRPHRVPSPELHLALAFQHLLAPGGHQAALFGHALAHAFALGSHLLLPPPHLLLALVLPLLHPLAHEPLLLHTLLLAVSVLLVECIGAAIAVASIAPPSKCNTDTCPAGRRRRCGLCWGWIRCPCKGIAC